MNRFQQGYIWRIGRSWYARWYRDEIENGQVVRRQHSEKLADYCDRYRTKNDVRPLLDEKLASQNNGRADARGTLSVAAFGRDYWLPWIEENCKPSTIHGYKKLWEQLEPRLERLALRDFRTVHAAELLATLHAENGLGRNSLKHVKSLLSGIFTLARNLGALDTPNPIQGAMLPKKAAAPAEMHAATVEEVLSILATLENGEPADSEYTKAEISALDRLQARVAVALCFFCGLRPGEARGARWEDFDGQILAVRQSVWRTHTTAPKTEAAASPVPVIEPLKGLLVELREIDSNPTDGPILRGPSGKARNLENLRKHVIKPILDKAGLTWHGWYALRRGIATTIAGVSKDPMASKGLLRHTSVLTTAQHYIKNVPENTLAAAKSLESLCRDYEKMGVGQPN